MPVREGNNSSLPYRSPVTQTAGTPKYSKDEAEYSTLEIVRAIFAEAIDGLYKEFNAFDVLGDGTDEQIKDKMMRQIAGNQIAYDILAPLKERIDSALNIADENHKQRNA